MLTSFSATACLQAAISSNGDLFMWGRGDSGQLGLGDNRARSMPTLVQGSTVVHPGEQDVLFFTGFLSA